MTKNKFFEFFMLNLCVGFCFGICIFGTKSLFRHFLQILRNTAINSTETALAFERLALILLLMNFILLFVFYVRRKNA